MKFFKVWRDEDKCRDVEVYSAKNYRTLRAHLQKDCPEEDVENFLYIEEVKPILVKS